jgi:hypothetical protein
MHPTAARLRTERALDQHSVANAATVIAPAVEGAHVGGRTTIVMAPHAAARRMQVTNLGRRPLVANGVPKMGDASTTDTWEWPAGVPERV